MSATAPISCPSIHLNDVYSIDCVEFLSSHWSSEDTTSQSKVSHEGFSLHDLPAPSKFIRKSRIIGGTPSLVPVCTITPRVDARMESVIRSHHQYVYSLIIQDEELCDSRGTHNESRWDDDAKFL